MKKVKKVKAWALANSSIGINALGTFQVYMTQREALEAQKTYIYLKNLILVEIIPLTTKQRRNKK